MIESLRSHWFVACTSAALGARPLARTILGLPLALFRSGGRAAALVDRCPHRNAALSQGRVVDGLLQCPYHGWRFDGEGACRAIPGRSACATESLPHQRAQAVSVEERDGFVWVHLGPNAEPRPALPVWPHSALNDSTFDTFTWAAEADGSFIDGLENLLDACHPHFTHAGWVRVSKRRRKVAVTIRRTAEKVEAVYREDRVPEGLIPRLIEGKRQASIGRFFPPATAQLDYVGEQGSRFLLTSQFTPCDERRMLIHSMISTRRGLLPASLKNAALRWVFGRILRQDQDALREQQANIDRFGGPAFTSTPLDVMRPHLLYFLSHPDAATRSDYESSVTMEL